MRVLRVATVPFFVLHHLRAQIEDTLAAGHEVIVAASDGEGAEELRRMPGIRFVGVDIPREISFFRDLRALFALLRVVRETRPDILHSTTPKAGLLGALAGWLAGVPVRLHTFTGQAWATRSGPVRWIARFCDWVVVKLNTRCYADSESQRRFMVEQGVCREGEVGVLGTGSLAGVDLRRFNRELLFPRKASLRERYGVPEGARVLCFVGRIARDKGVFELIEAFRRVKAEIPSAVLLMVGPEESAEPIPRDPAIRVVGYDPNPENFLAISELLCLPSYREGFGNVVIEAGALGVPAVGTKIPGLVDAIVDGVTGTLVPARDADALAKAILRLLRDDALRKRMGEAARARAEAQFDSKRVNGLVLEEYRRLLPQSRP